MVFLDRKYQFPYCGWTSILSSSSPSGQIITCKATFVIPFLNSNIKTKFKFNIGQLYFRVFLRVSEVR